MGHGTLQKMGLIQKTEGAPFSISTLTPKPFRAHSTLIKSTMMGLLHKLKCKVLKNQKTLVPNQRQLAACYNTGHPNHPIVLGSVNGSDSDDEPEGEEAFDIRASQFQEDPHSEDEEMAMHNAADGSATRDDEDEDEDNDKDKEESESEEDERDANGELVVAVGAESESNDD